MEQREAMNSGEATIDAATRSRVIAGVLHYLRTYYLYPNTAEEIARTIEQRMDRGDFDAITNASTLCDTLTVHLQEASHDKHLQARYDVEPQALSESANEFDDPAVLERRRLAISVRNYGFERVERLSGNIGYLDLRFFSPVWSGCGDTATAAMTFLANTNALIIDLRNNTGGGVGLMDYLCSYLLPAVPEHPIHLIDLHYSDHLEQHWTLPHVPGPRYADKPVYILTSGRTISAGEAFAYTLQALKRATIVGETTAGASNLAGLYRIDTHFAVVISNGRVIVPSAGGDWEGTGVHPDLAVPEGNALQTAHVAALKRVLEIADVATMDLARVVREEVRKGLAELERREMDADRVLCPP